MKQRLTQAATNSNARYVGLGLLSGLALLVVALIWRGSRSDTLVLNVQPLDDTRSIRVYVGGAVASPGLYTLERGSRVADAIEAAGGVTVDGDTSGFGMAAPLRDADQIIVPTLPTPTAEVDSARDPNGGENPGTGADTPGAGLVNINTATASELEELPGIGPALAERIIDHRTRHGFFRSVDELELISGISQRMVDELRPLLTTGP